MARLITSKADETRIVCIDVSNTELPKLIGVAHDFGIADFEIRPLQSDEPLSSFNVRFTLIQDRYDLFLAAAKKHLRINGE